VRSEGGSQRRDLGEGRDALVSVGGCSVMDVRGLWQQSVDTGGMCTRASKPEGR
jgi:hypothetical protein